MGVYGATKYAVEALSDALRQEVVGFGIKVIIIEPAFVATNIGEAADAGAATASPASNSPAAAATTAISFRTCMTSSGHQRGLLAASGDVVRASAVVDGHVQLPT